MLAYIAGFFDGEGCVHFRCGPEGDWHSYLSISNTAREPLEIAQELFGGQIYGSPKKGSNYIVWQWNVAGSEAEHCATKLMPFCIVKREQLRSFLHGRKTFAVGKRISPESRAIREACAARIRVLRSGQVEGAARHALR